MSYFYDKMRWVQLKEDKIPQLLESIKKHIPQAAQAYNQAYFQHEKTTFSINTLKVCQDIKK
jgi:hypothetical protein